MRGGSRIRTPLSYHPGLDRLVGGDFLRELQGRWTQSTLMSLRRAGKLYPHMLRFGEAYDAGFPPQTDSRPYPRPLAVLQLEAYPVQHMGESWTVPIETLLEADGLVAAPLEYRQLAQLVSIVPDSVTVRESAPDARPARNAFAAQLFRLIGFAHGRFEGTLSRHGGSCIEPRYLTPAGALQDLYFLTGSDDVAPGVLLEGRRRDLVEGLSLLVRSEGENETLPEGLARRALSSYGEASERPGRVDTWLEKAELSWSGTEGRPSRRVEALTQLAETMLTP